MPKGQQENQNKVLGLQLRQNKRLESDKMSKKNPQTLGELKKSGYIPKSIKQEMRDNLIQFIRENKNPFEKIIGYDETVLQQVRTAILSKHDIILLGQRGQGKTRLLRSLTQLLDEQIPFLKDSPLHEDPFNPILKSSQKKVAELGDDTPIDWLSRSDRYGEKLATPDVNVADLIGDMDPIKAMNLKLAMDHEESIHFGLIPRCNRGLFVINELPDLQARIQVSLLNIMEERDIQIRGFKIRLPLDIMLAFSANPEDYTNRGRIITPLKDRIDSQIITHYPKALSVSQQITDQEANTQRDSVHIEIPDIVRKSLEQIAFEAREDKDYIDPASGVSVRLSITALESFLSHTEIRGLLRQEQSLTARLNDLESVIPAITGKIELVYEGEKEGPIKIARALIGKAVKSIFHEYFIDPYNKKTSNPEQNPYHPITKWFEAGNALTIDTQQNDTDYWETFNQIPEFESTMKKCMLEQQKSFKGLSEKISYAELLLEGLLLNSHISKENVADGYVYRDMMAGILG